MQLNLAKCVEWICINILNILENIGGVAIVVAICSFITHKINVRFENKINAKYSGEIEKLKSQLDSLSHTRKTLFDAEFSIYQELCSAFAELHSAVHWLFPLGLDRAPATGNWKDICNERYKTAQEKYNVAISILGGKAPFIKIEIHERFFEIAKLSALQIHCYAFSEPFSPDCKSSSSIKEIESKGSDRTQEIDAKWEALVDELRDYFDNIKQ